MERKSNFEAYRIVCIMLIVIMHTFGSGTGEFNTQLGIFLNVIGNIGVTGFVLLSGYFGIRLKWKKLAKLDIMMIFWSVAGMILLTLNPMAGYQPSKKDLLGCLIPVSSHRYWFLTAYFFLCILSPFINEYLEKIDKKRFQRLILTAGALFLLLPTLVGFDQTGDGGKGIVNMILSYVIGRYIGMYHKDEKCSPAKIGSILAGVILVNFFLNVFLYRISGSTANYFARDNSIFTMVQAVLLLFLFKQFEGQSRLINLLSANVVAVYVLEDVIKLPIRTEIAPYVMMADSGMPGYIIWVLLISVVTFLAGTVLEAVRKKIFGKVEDFVLNQIGNKVAKWKKQ